MFYVLRLKRLGGLAAVLCFLTAAFLILRSVNMLSPVQTAEIAERVPVLVIDAGHGGFDGGAVAVNGVRESDINLSIAQKMETIGSFCGLQTVMTRSDDSRRTDLLSYSEHEDLVHRAKIVNSVPGAVLISIHQNFYPTTQPFGAQVLYASDEQSTALGKLVQSNIVSHLQPDNRRLAIPASPELFLTSHVNCPAVLVECGFLSNHNEMERLTEARYQTAMAAVILSSYLNFLPQLEHL